MSTTEVRDFIRSVTYRFTGPSIETSLDAARKSACATVSIGECIYENLYLVKLAGLITQSFTWRWNMIKPRQESLFSLRCLFLDYATSELIRRASLWLKVSLRGSIVPLAGLVACISLPAQFRLLDPQPLDLDKVALTLDAGVHSAAVNGLSFSPDGNLL